MSNLYIHYPFCKQACHYCNFHFSTSKDGRNDMFKLIKNELHLRSKELINPIESIYFGGGSPSLISTKNISDFIDLIKNKFEVKKNIEVTLEVNPDDVDEEYLKKIKDSGVNRLSIGIQSFFEKDLIIMNRAHNVHQAHKSLESVSKFFQNFSIDLIYGMPYSSLTNWKNNLEIALSYNPPHISAYALTVEEKTVLYHKVKEKKIDLLDDDDVKQQYEILVNTLEHKGYINYEFSNFAKQNYFSINNQNYWIGKPYLGLGPSAHSYDGKFQRSWNVSNNHNYAKSIISGVLDLKIEKLSIKDLYNEYLMTALRTHEGVSLAHVKKTFGKRYTMYLEDQVKRHFKYRNLFWDGDFLKVTKKAKFLTDGIAADLFLV